MIKVSNKLRVKHFPNIPCKPFTVDVKDEVEAYLIENTLANQHLFLFENNFIPDYSNIITIVMWDEEEMDWVDYWNEEEMMEWDEFVDTYLNPTEE